MHRKVLKPNHECEPKQLGRFIVCKICGTILNKELAERSLKHEGK